MDESEKPIPTFASAYDLLAWKASPEERDELVVEDYARVIAAASPRHNRIAVNLMAALNSALPRECVCFASGLKISTLGGAQYRHADASVVCGPCRFEGDVLSNPTVLVEILSQSTETRKKLKRCGDGEA